MALPPRLELPGDPDAEDEEDLRSRTDARRDRKQSEESLMRLAWALVELPDRTLQRLKLPEGILDVIVRARLVPDGGPKNRALRLVRIVLRDGDAEGIAQALKDVHDPPRKGAPPPVSKREPTAVEQSVGKLVDGGEDALTEYVTAHPDADRRQLRQLVRNVRKATDVTRPDAVATLTRALRRSL
jgi:ribosome-associated protein